jgi:hypothetical protein
MTNPYFSKLPLEKAIDTIVSGSKRFKLEGTNHEEFIAEDPDYIKWDVLFTSTDKREATKRLRKAID